MRDEFLNYLAAATKVIVVAVLLGESFLSVTRLLRPVDFFPAENAAVIAPIVAPLIVHALIVALAWITMRQPALCLVGPGGNRKSVTTAITIVGPGWLALAATAAVATSIWIPVSFHGARDPGLAPPPAFWWLATVMLAPILEELVYRGLISPRLRRDCGNIAGSYFAAVLFAWVHTGPTLAGILAGNPGGVPPGPLLLALIADWLYLEFRSIWVPVAFHAACNATPAVFGNLDPRWLRWLGELYQ